MAWEPQMATLPIEIDLRQLTEFSRKSHIRRLAVFGSALREDFRPDSDLDLLVEFEPGRTPGLAFFEIQEHQRPHTNLAERCGPRAGVSA